MAGIKLEICCGSAEDVYEAWKAGADRVELNSNLFQGGITPTLGELEVAKRHTDISVMAMIRPRAAGFCYSEMEYETALRDADLLLKHGADGVVFGFLNPDGTVDRQRTREMVKLAGERQTCFHRALDVTPDWKRALETLIELGVTRVLTSGQAPDVFFALDTLAQMIRFAGDSIQIMPGAGITADNVRRVVEATGCSQVHLARHRRVSDSSTANHRDIYFGGALYPPEDSYELTDRAYVDGIARELHSR